MRLHVRSPGECSPHFSLPREAWSFHARSRITAVATNNLAAAFRIMHAQVNATLGISADARQSVSSDQLELALNQIDEIGDTAQSRIAEALGDRDDA